jgi:hypothetical protein
MLGTDLGQHRASGGAGGTINISAGTFTAASAQGTAIGTLSVSGGTGTYTFTLTDSHANAVQVIGTSLQVGSASSTASSFSITIHADNGAGSTLNGTFLITALVAATATWQTLKVGGGGNMRGMDIVRSDNTLLARSDTHPALWTFNAAQNKWLPLITAYSMPTAYQVSFGTNAANGCWEARICPSLTTKFYMMYGGTIGAGPTVPFVSTNSGGTWTQVSSGFPTVNDADANGGSVGNSYKMAVDPANDAICYIGTPSAGLQKTSNSGASWATDTGVTASTTLGIAIAFDPSSSVVSGVTQGIFACSSGQGVWHSTNGGSSWTKLNTTHMPTAFAQMIVDQNGKLWVACGFTGGLVTWTPGGGWVVNSLTDTPNAIAVDPNNASHVASSSGGGHTYLSTDSGVTWTPPIISTTVDASLDAPWQNWGPTQGYAGTTHAGGPSVGSYGTSVNCMVFDSSSNLYQAWGFGLWKSTAPFATPNTSISWLGFSRGTENLDTNYIIHPPGGNPIGVAWDLSIWNFPDPTVYASYYGTNDDFNGPMPRFGVPNGRGWNIEYASGPTSFLTAIVAFGQGGYWSSDKGVTWTPFTKTAGVDPFTNIGNGGCIASSTTTNHVVMCASTAPAYTTDNGATWTACTYAGNGFDNFPFANSIFVCADRVTANKFYMYSTTDGWYSSTNSGATFTKVSSFNVATGLSRAKCVPGNAGHIFWTNGISLNQVPISTDQLYWSTNSAVTWSSALSDFDTIMDFGFGTVVSGQTYPTIYLAAYRISTGITGVYKCNNFNPSTGAGTWTLMANADGSNYPEGWFAAISGVAGDPAIDNHCSLSYTNGGFKRFA